MITGIPIMGSRHTAYQSSASVPCKKWRSLAGHWPSLPLSKLFDLPAFTEFGVTENGICHSHASAKREQEPIVRNPLERRRLPKTKILAASRHENRQVPSIMGPSV